MWTIVLISRCIGVGYVIRPLPGAMDKCPSICVAPCSPCCGCYDARSFEHGGKLVGIMTVMGFLVAAILAFIQ
jgi:hypothetical protein